MARPLSSSPPPSGAMNYQPRYSLDDAPTATNDPGPELDALRAENDQLRTLCADLEQALQEATQQQFDPGAYEERMREYEQLLEEKNEMIRQLHEKLGELQAAVEEAETRSNPTGQRAYQGPLPREEELLTLSEELERERRQLQEDEQTLMEQMRQMEVTMARERAEMARQRNDLQRLYGEVRHELERLERNGALQSKMDELKNKLQDVASRRGAAPPTMGPAPAPATLTNLNQTPLPAPPRPGSFVGRWFGGNK